MTLRNFLQIIILSFYSSELYINVSRKWRHWGLNFLLKFSIFSALVFSLTLFVVVASFDVNSVFMPLVKQIPNITIDKDQAFIVDKEIKMPMHLNFSDSDKVSMIVDLDITDANKYQQNAIVFTKDRISVNLLGASNFAVSYKDLQMHELNSDAVMKFFADCKSKALGAILTLGCTLGSFFLFFANLIKSLFYAALASTLLKLTSNALNFKQILRLAIVANAPASLISSILLMLFFNSGLLVIMQPIADAVYVLYFSWAVIISKR
jgi:hypothetical protein